MLPVAIVTVLFALLIIWGASVGALGAGAMLFAGGFVILGAIAALNYVRSRKATVF